MTSSGDPLPPRRRWPRILGWSCLTLAAVTALSVFASLCSVYVSHGHEARQRNEKNFAQISPILPALDAYRRANGHYPKSLCDLRLKHLHLSAQVLYTASENGSEYWLAIFPWYTAGFFMPSDTAREYSSASHRWTETDVDAATAKYDEAWGKDCRAETMTSTR